MRQYLDLMQDILDNGSRKPNRTEIDALSVFGRQMRFDLGEGFPLLELASVMAFRNSSRSFWTSSGGIVLLSGVLGMIVPRCSFSSLEMRSRAASIRRSVSGGSSRS